MLYSCGVSDWGKHSWRLESLLLTTGIPSVPWCHHCLKVFWVQSSFIIVSYQRCWMKTFFLFGSPAWSRKPSGACAYPLTEIYSFHTNPRLLLVVRRKAPRIKTQLPVFSAFHSAPHLFSKRYHFPLLFVCDRLRHCLFKSKGKRKENDDLSQFLPLRGKRTFPSYIARFV